MRNTFTRPSYLQIARNKVRKNTKVTKTYYVPPTPEFATMYILTFVYCPVMGLIHTYKEDNYLPL